MMSINILPKPSINDAIYFSSKNNTRISFPSINNDVNYYHFKRKNNVNYGLTYVQRKVCVGVYRQACSGIPLAVGFVGRDRLL